MSFGTYDPCPRCVGSAKMQRSPVYTNAPPLFASDTPRVSCPTPLFYLPSAQSASLYTGLVTENLYPTMRRSYGPYVGHLMDYRKDPLIFLEN